MTCLMLNAILAAVVGCSFAAAHAQSQSGPADPPIRDAARADISQAAAKPGDDAAAQIQALLDEDLREVFRHRPLYATVLGVPGYNDLLPDFSAASRERERAYERRTLTRL
jgi:ribosomal protein S12 methylthiotransferase accessory factor YcaO